MSNENIQSTSSSLASMSDSKIRIGSYWTALSSNGMNAIKYLLLDPEAGFIMMIVLFLFELVLVHLIIRFIPYTEIDYLAYMEQIWTIKNGERNYSKIEGGTGPLVYPAGHVLIYNWMEKITDGLENLKSGQNLFGYLYMATLMMQFCCFAILNLPPWCMVMGCLSKRLHSIYVLRLFNDCWTTFFIVFTVLLFLLSARYKNYYLCVTGSLTYAVAVSIKMNALLYLPGVLISVFLLSQGSLLVLLWSVFIMIGWQVYVAREYLAAYPLEYLTIAFNFGRKFMYKWSINWQIVSEDVFGNELFHKMLLLGHITILAFFIFTRYCPPSNGSWFQIAYSAFRQPLSKVLNIYPSPLYIAYTLLVTNFIGVLFSRSLHYQFLSWYHWTIPILIHWSCMPITCAIPWYILHEYCWNSYPPKSTASLLLHLLNATLLILIYLNRSLIDITLPQRPSQEEQTKED
ncbi:dolichyl-P-Man:Man(5)GlcNAc(2)-PP-dolichol alpha-1,3-mannosyltransferase Ecym_7147 [Eremothecium cymbalariae DBVPG|uniref:Dol-P-Man:Man(5)GlcNAc(2)-PP-Dol alpha-1,3-mannosyltransferase n=1 Tax=Eremothecium cymbalariae (strain CBS 270.75 / DBVPG 7215 / KCTC 17166 / NRRL Y-17582) TaxID=931890 RepID=G8JVY1_ERECY|nr:hypothetical protein Ecym_7147 [Eremothecium cymbalariae DBVPG\